MNRYGHLAMQLWQNDPQRLAAIQDSQTFFTDLGEQLQTQIEELTDQIAGADPPGETYLAKVSRLNNARTMAEEIVLADLPAIGDGEPDPQTPSPVDEIMTAIHRAGQDLT